MKIPMNSKPENETNYSYYVTLTHFFVFFLLLWIDFNKRKWENNTINTIFNGGRVLWIWNCWLYTTTTCRCV